MSSLKQNVVAYDELHRDLNNHLDYIDLLQDEPDLPPDMLQDVCCQLDQMEKSFRSFEVTSLLSEEFDRHNAIFVITAGAGGTDAQDWALMLYRMYTRFFEIQKYKYEVSDYTPGEEAGLKGATLMVEGLFAFGYLKNEIGIHRLVRLSPFNANDKRQTSFASVDVMPQLESDSSIEIKPDELRIDTFRSSGAGGQHVNKTDSAIRITHIPTGTVVQCQSGRSQTRNKEMAMQILHSRLYSLKMDEQKESMTKARSEKKDIAWGHQIRSYVFHPYTMVKDHRTKIETANVNSVMDGNILEFIEGNLRLLLSAKSE